ncbi:hypothetical protein PR002_g26641 [Phytophthora rubi]|uniref:Timeless N-terminal domain-containing protein n=1 Tax=Phytophthora rubi TaxID=129364 RepID=A0A6A3HVM4_9STRA|nr:hypothetical protein PR002_g26641 [Phytophthora rubi]
MMDKMLLVCSNLVMPTPVGSPFSCAARIASSGSTTCSTRYDARQVEDPAESAVAAAREPPARLGARILCDEGAGRAHDDAAQGLDQHCAAAPRVPAVSQGSARTGQNYRNMEIVLTLIQNLLVVPNKDPRFVTSTASHFTTYRKQRYS